MADSGLITTRKKTPVYVVMCWEKVFLSTTSRILMSVNRENIDSINDDELFNIVIVRSV